MLDDKDPEEVERLMTRNVVLGMDLLGIFMLILILACATCHGMPIREALSQLESGNRDKAVGRSKEVSRFQILPAIWRQHSSTRNYQDADHAWNVTRRILAPRCLAFSAATGRQPRHRELYCLWNAPGAFRRANYHVPGVGKMIRERAQRFENLVNK